jgi:peptidoglycan hydrolase CwlO-like protein
MATLSPAQQIDEEIRAMQSKIGDLQESVRLTKIRNEVADAQTTINDLAQRIATFRTRNYVFEKDLENHPGRFCLPICNPKLICNQRHS